MSKTLITLPPGIAVYPALNRPDTKYNDNGDYKANVRLSEAAAAATIKALQVKAKEYLGRVLPKSGNTCWKPVLDDEGEETGDVIFNIRASNRIAKKTGKLWDRKPLLLDAKKKPLSDDIAVWGGSKIRVQVEVEERQNKDGQKSLRLVPVVVQVIDLVTGSGGGQPDLDAFDEEDGFEAGNDLSAFGDESGSAGGSNAADDEY